MKFEEKLQNLRKASSLSQEQLADKLGVSRQSVSKWESGSTYPEMDKLLAMCKIFKCSLDDLVNDEATDKTIMKKNNKKSENYLDSFLSFITKSVNMFCSMKLTSAIKCFFELFLLGCVLFCILAIIFSIVLGITDSVSFSNAFFVFLVTLFDGLIFAVCLSTAFIIFIQFYKIRYLDYYEKAVYEYDQRKDFSEHLKKSKEESAVLKKEEKNHIIIRDPKHQPFLFLSLISKMIVFIVKCIVGFFAFWFVLSLVFLCIGFFICLFMIPINIIFLFLNLCLLGLLIVNFEVLEFVYDFILNKKFAIKRMTLLFLSAIVIFSLGIGASVIKLKDFQFLKNDQAKIKTQKIKYDENVTFLSDHGLYFEIDEKRDDILVSTVYEEDFFSIDVVERQGIYYVEYDYKDYNVNRIINRVLTDLKKNIIRDYSGSSLETEYAIKITANEKNIQNMIKNLSKKMYYDLRKTIDGYYILPDDYVGVDAYCHINKEGYYDCIELQNDPVCKTEVDEFGVVKTSDNCECSHYRHDYDCFPKVEEDE